MWFNKAVNVKEILYESSSIQLLYAGLPQSNPLHMNVNYYIANRWRLKLREKKKIKRLKKQIEKKLKSSNEHSTCRN